MKWPGGRESVMSISSHDQAIRTAGDGGQATWYNIIMHSCLHMTENLNR